jgi:hypothetical protein
MNTIHPRFWRRVDQHTWDELQVPGPVVPPGLAEWVAYSKAYWARQERMGGGQHGQGQITRTTVAAHEPRTPA